MKPKLLDIDILCFNKLLFQNIIFALDKWTKQTDKIKKNIDDSIRSQTILLLTKLIFVLLIPSYLYSSCSISSMKKICHIQPLLPPAHHQLPSSGPQKLLQLSQVAALEQQPVQTLVDHALHELPSALKVQLDGLLEVGLRPGYFCRSTSTRKYLLDHSFVLTE